MPESLFDRPATLLKRDSGTDVFLWILRNFQEHLFYITPLGDCFFEVKTGRRNMIVYNFFLLFLFWKFYFSYFSGFNNINLDSAKRKYKRKYMFKVNYITSQNYTLVFSLVFPSLTLNTALINVCILLSVYVPWNCVFIKLFYTLSRTCLRPTHKKGMDILSKKQTKKTIRLWVIISTQFQVFPKIGSPEVFCKKKVFLKILQNS